MTFTIPPIVFKILEAILIGVGAYFVVFWFGLVVWTFQDIRRRTHDWMLQIICVLLVLVFHLAGLIIYLIIRPQDTLADIEGRAIEEEALLQGLEERIACPSCHKAAQPDFAICPYCGERLKRVCVSCGRLLALNWTVCPYCTTPVRVPESAEAAAAPETQPTGILPALETADRGQPEKVAPQVEEPAPTPEPEAVGSLVTADMGERRPET